MKATDKQLYEFCQNHPELRVERSAEGELIVMPPAFADTGVDPEQVSYEPEIPGLAFRMAYIW